MRERSRTRRGRRLLASTMAIAALAGFAPFAAPAVDVQASSASSLDGSTPADAAASCWEIKQLHPSRGDGVYWLWTAGLERPEQFYCEMDHDGGGWVLIGRGREGWTFREYGQLTPQLIRENVTGPAAFAPGSLSTELIDGLLDGGDASDLVDGVRIRRATDTAGTSWQEVRWYLHDLASWSWGFGGGHRLSSWSIDGSAGTGSNTQDSSLEMPGEVGAGNRSGTDFDRWFTFPWVGHGSVAGFAYGSGVGGSNSSTSYLWELASENHAIPFAQVFIRPRLTTPALPVIPTGGVPAQVQSAMLDDRPEVLAGGVSGVLEVGDSEPHLDTPVLAITTLGDRVYVGGKFSTVEDSSGTSVSHPYLAAFDRTTGAWIPSFDPDLDGTVWDLAIAGGRLIVAGQFTNVDGAPLTAGLAALDPTTGAVDPGWKASMTLSGSSARPYARAIDVEGSWIYVGGNFTRIESNGVSRAMGRLGRVEVADGDPDVSFRPDVDGVPYKLDVAAGRVYVVGDFDGVDGDDNRGVAILDSTTGAKISGLQDPSWTTGSDDRRYQQAIAAVGSQVWQGGSEHNVHVYRESDYALLKSYVTSGTGGDTQAIAEVGGYVYQGSHGRSWIYEDATTWPGLDGYTRIDDYKWVGAFDATTRQYDKHWVPSLGVAGGEGVWELHPDPTDGCLWFGGDVNGGPFVGGQRQFLEGFSKFCARDAAAPTVPSGPSATVEGGGVRVGWSASSDDRPGFVGYEILRNDRVVSPLVYGTTYLDPTGSVDDRYFVRAVDPAGNRSASTSAFSADPPPNPPPPTIPPSPPIPPSGVPAGSQTVIAGRPNGIAIVSVGVTQTAGAGYFQLLSCGETPGAYSTLNADRAGQTIANLAIIQLDANGTACVYNESVSHLFVDLQGYLDPSAFTPQLARLVDTRAKGQKVGAGGRVPFSGTPNGLAVVSIVATQSTGPGYLQALGCGAAPGAYSNLNVDRAGQTIANLAIVQLDAAGQSCVYSQGGAHVIVDLQGYLDPGSFTVSSQRLLDTRMPGPSTPPVTAGDRVAAGGQANGLAVLSVVATQTEAPGYVQLLGCAETPGAYSNLNADRAGQTIANLAVIELDGGGQTCVYTQGGAHLIADLQGYLDPADFDPEPVRLLDTR